MSALIGESMTGGYGGADVLQGCTIGVEAGEIAVIVGPNGAGKTTLFRMITGDETPDGGELRIGESVQLGFVDQSRDALDNDSTVWEEISQGEAEIDLGKRKRVIDCSLKERPRISTFSAFLRQVCN